MAALEMFVCLLVSHSLSANSNDQDASDAHGPGSAAEGKYSHCDSTGWLLAVTARAGQQDANSRERHTLPSV